MENRSYPWTEQIVKLLEEADELNGRGAKLAATTYRQLTRPSALRTGDAEGGVSLIALMDSNLDDASSHLSRCVSAMEAAELIDHSRGPATRTRRALAAEAELVDRRTGPAARMRREQAGECESALSVSMAWLQEVALTHVEDALRAIERCRGHLGAAKLLLLRHDGGVPGVDACIEAERVAAVCALEHAMFSVVLCSIPIC